MARSGGRGLKRLRWLGSWLIVLSPLAFYLALLPRFGYLQNNDYYHVLSQITEGSELSADPRAWLTVTANEHRATVPAMLYALNAWLNHGNNRALSALALAGMVAVFAMLYRQLPPAIRGDDLRRTAFGLILAGLVFTPVAVHCVAMGFSGSQWLLANVVSVAILSMWIRRPEGSIQALLPLLILGLVGIFVYTTSIAVWPALILGALLLGISWRRIALLVVCGVLVGGVYLSGFQTPDHMPQPTSESSSTLPFLAAYLGSIFSRDPATAKLFGVLGMLAAVVLLVLTRTGSAGLRRDTVLWTMLQAWGLFNACATTVARSAGAEKAAFSSRYTTVSGLFWLGLLVAGGLIVHHAVANRGSRLRLSAYAGMLLIVGGLLAATYARGLPVVWRFLARAANQQLAAVALVRGVHDNDWLRTNLVADPRRVWRVRDYLEANRHVPFDRGWKMPAQRQIPSTDLETAHHPEVWGWLDGLHAVGTGKTWRLQGWAFSTAAPVLEVVLVDSHGSTRGEIVTGLVRLNAGNNLGAAANWSGWAAYVEGDRAPEIRAYIRLEGDRRYYPLKTLPPIEKRIESAERHVASAGRT